MGAKRDLAMAALAVIGAATAVRRAARRRPPRRGGSWFAVTVDCHPSTMLGATRPNPLEYLARRHELLIGPAPGDRGCEIAVRAGDTTGQRRLRAVKQLLETGEVLRVDGQPEGHRTAVGRATLPLVREWATRSAP